MPCPEICAVSGEAAGRLEEDEISLVIQFGWRISVVIDYQWWYGLTGLWLAKVSYGSLVPTEHVCPLHTLPFIYILRNHGAQLSQKPCFCDCRRSHFRDEETTKS